MERPRLAIVIPALNESRTIANVISAIRDLGTVVVVDDGSSDGTGAVATSAGAEVVRHERPRGYDAALQSGFAHAVQSGVDFIITCDADGQHRPESVARVRDLLLGGAELVVGIRPKPARMAEWLFALYARTRFGLCDPLCGLKGYRSALYVAHGCFDSRRSIGTELALASLRGRCSFCQLWIPIADRATPSRFGSTLRGNWRILRALVLEIAAGR